MIDKNSFDPDEWDGDPDDLVPLTERLSDDEDLCERLFCSEKEAYNSGRYLEARRILGAGHYKQLTARDTASLRPFAFDTVREQRIVGAPVVEAIASVGPWRDWLEAAVFAGYVPGFEGLALALRATNLLWRREIEQGIVSDGQALAFAARGAEALRDLARGLDGFANEPQAPEALRGLPNVVLTPHIASATVETRAAMTRIVVDNVLAFERGGPLKTPV